MRGRDYSDQQTIAANQNIKERNYWLDKLSGKLVKSSFPYDYNRIEESEDSPGIVNFTFSGELYSTLMKMSNERDHTLHMILVTGIVILLDKYNYNSSKDIIVGAPIYKQKRETEFINTVVALQNRIEEGMTFKDLLVQVRQTIIEADKNQNYPIEILVQQLNIENPGKGFPLFDVAVLIQNIHNKKYLQGIKTNMTFLFSRTNEFIEGVLEYNAGLYRESTVERITNHLRNFLQNVFVDVEGKISDVDILSAQERKQLLYDFNDNDADFSRDKTIYQFIEDHGETKPERAAVIFAGERVSYRELNEKANQLAGVLRDVGVHVDQPVGILLHRSPLMVESILAVWKAGGAYIPIDTQYPVQRIKDILNDSGCNVLITRSQYIDADLQAEYKGRVIHLDTQAADIGRKSKRNPGLESKMNSLSYIIYTSGSTGKPKGVMVEHIGMMNHIQAKINDLQITGKSIVAQNATHCFDISVWQFFVALTVGGKTVIYPNSLVLEPDQLMNRVMEDGVTILEVVPSYLSVMLSALEVNARNFEYLRYLLVTGEAVNPNLLEQWFKKYQGIKVVNAYGPTEASDDITHFIMDKTPEMERIPIGKPLQNLNIYIVNRDMQLCPIGVTGEIWVSGVGVGRGYIRNKEKTRQAFMEDPFIGKKGIRLYKTGDLGRWLPDGNIDFLGRIDDQVKVRGFRIECGEIESVLLKHEKVKEAVVVTREDEKKNNYLAAYVVIGEEEKLDVNQLRDYVKETLPDYMVPGYFVRLGRLPLTDSGKINKRALPEPEITPAAGTGYEMPRNETEAVLAKIWQEVLDIDRVGIHDNFFNLGGDSIKGIRVVNKIQRRLGEIIHVTMIFEAPTIKELAVCLESYKDRKSARIDVAKLAEFREVIRPLPSLKTTAPKNPPAVFILSAPRTGSTLLRVILAGHSRIFAPQELELLLFDTLQDRKAELSGPFRHFTEGTIRAIMEIKSCGPGEGKTIMQEFEKQNLTTRQFYGTIQQWLGDKLLVDKTANYALNPEALQRAEKYFESPLYIHLTRHPYAVIHSYEEAKLDQVFRYKHNFSLRELAELVWLLSEQNIREFFKEIPGNRKHFVRFEELVHEPASVVKGICEFLGLEFEEEMIQVYKDTERKMTDGIYAESRMIGDVKFFQHSTIDAGVVDKWRGKLPGDFLGDISLEMAQSLGYLAEVVVTGYAGIEPAEESGYYPLSHAQRRLWILDQFENVQTAYIIPAAYIIEGELDIEALEKAFVSIIKRHESLRTTFILVEGEPKQKIQDRASTEFRLESVDLSGKGERCGDEHIENLVSQEAETSFNLASSPLIRAKLMRLEENRYLFLLTMHHIISDGWSIGILVKELLSLYDAYKEGKDNPLLPLMLQYKDYSLWQNSEKQQAALSVQMSYWKKQFEGEIPVLDLPTDYPRPGIQSFAGSRISFEMGRGETGKLNALAEGEGVTTYMILLAIYNIFLSKISNREVIVTGTPVAGRKHADVENIIGMFVNTLVVKSYPLGEKIFIEFLKQSGEKVLEIFENQDYPYENLVELLPVPRETARNPLFDVMFVMQNVDVEELEIPGLSLRPYQYESKTAKFDLMLVAIEAKENLQFTFEYSTQLFKEETIWRFTRYFKKIVSGILAKPAVKLSEIEIISETEKRQVLTEFNGTVSNYPSDKWIHQLFEEEVEKRAEKVAVVYKDEALTYHVLNRRADKLASILRGRGVKSEEPVGIVSETCLEMIVGVLAILKAGGVYLPIDPDYPQERIDFMLKDSNAGVLLKKSEIRISKFETNPNDRNSNDQNEVTTSIVLDFEHRNFEFLNGCPSLGLSDFEFRASNLSSSNLAYIIYTSGSTGRPKGVLVEHGNVVRLVKNTNYVTFKEGDRILQTGALEFDASTFEIWGTLLNGLTLYLAPKDKLLTPGKLKHIIKVGHITTMWMTSPLFNQMVQSDVEIFTGLQNLLVGGDVLSPAHINQVKKRFPQLSIINGYGPTENTTFSTTFLIEEEYRESIPIGKPIANSTAYIVDREGILQPIGIAGELLVGGDGAARGYLNNPELTAERFFSFSYRSYRSYISKKIYKTGDLARWLVDGNIQFLGRMDQQVKIRGFRIEPGEIETYLLKHGDIKETVVVAKDDHKGDKYLCAYIVPGNDISAAELRKLLSKDLPDYMIPSYFVPLEEIPLTPNGKIDWRALPEPQIEVLGGRYAAPRDEIEETLAEIWADILGIEKDVIGIDSDFFDLGGHSIKATLLAAKIHKEMHIDVSLTEIFTTPTVSGLAQYIKRSAKDKFRPINKAEKRDHYLLSSAQRRLYVLQQMDRQGIGYNIPSVFRVEENVDKKRLEDTFRQLLKRHESLRTSFEMVEQEPVQKIHDPEDVEFKIEYFEAAGMEEGRRGPKDIEELIRHFIRHFDLSCAPLLRVGMIKQEETKHLLMVDMHHIISDGISMEIFVKDFLAIYAKDERPALRLQYRDFVLWQDSDKEKQLIQRQKEYWQNQFEGGVPVLNLPTDFFRPAVPSFKGANLNFEIDGEGVGALKKLASREETTLYMLLLAIYNIFLSKVCNQEDIIVGTPTAGRGHADLEHIIGMFVNSLALRNYPQGNKRFREFLKNVKANTLEAFENQDYQFEDLVETIALERNIGRNPLFDTAFGLQNLDIPMVDIPGLKLLPYEYENKISKFDLILAGTEEKEKLSFTTLYSTLLFKADTIGKFIGYFKQIVSSVLNDPEIRIYEIEILSDKEKEQVLYDFNSTRVDFPGNKTIHELFAEQVERTPGNTAIVHEKEEVTYLQLDEKANRLASVLREKGVSAGSIVGIMVENSVEIMTGILGILKAGGAYLPIDPAFPEKRILYMLEDADISLLLSKLDVLETHSPANLRGPRVTRLKPHCTAKRNQITELDQLPIPDRSLINNEKYDRYIGVAPVKNYILMQTTRGCPWNCVYCYKIWPKDHYSRSAENLFTEIQIYYNIGIRRFSIIDDVFNLNIDNSCRLFELIIKNGLNIQLFFPPGLRGDILTRNYIDLMVEAGATAFPLALETASPRLQKLIRKYLNLERLKENSDYICEKYPHVILELQSMLGFPSETEAEALMTLNFIKSLKWLHFPYVHILKIYPNTDMYQLALKKGVTEEAIEKSANLAWHQLPETLPFSKEFTLKYQADFFNDYFLSKERLLHVLPYQMKAMTEDEIIQKYDSFLPVDINSFADLLEFVGIKKEELEAKGAVVFLDENYSGAPHLNQEIRQYFNPQKSNPTALRILLLDLTQFFSQESHMLYDVVEQPLGLMYLLTYLNRQFGQKINGKIGKPRIDFDSYEELQALVEAFKPQLIGIRSLTFYRNFCHRTVAKLRQWMPDVPITAGGPYATSDYRTVLQDQNIDLVVLGEGEVTFSELVGKIIENDGKLPAEEELKKLAGIAFIPEKEVEKKTFARDLLMLDEIAETRSEKADENLKNNNHSLQPAYVIYTSDSSGRPKGVIIEHKSLVNLCHWHNTNYSVSSQDRAAVYTGSGFDAFAEETFPYLVTGAAIHIIDDDIKSDMYKLNRYFEDHGITIGFLPTHIAEQFMMLNNQSLRVLLTGGGQLNRYIDRSYRLVYHYGPTENTAVTSSFVVNHQYNNIPIGSPIYNNRIFILNKYNRLQPVGIPGELFTAGHGIARGYLNKPELTAEKFDHDLWDFQDYQDGPGDRRLYRTGDMARWLPDGNIEYLGRLDQQVTIRGYRVELKEIESRLLTHKNIQETVVVVREKEEGDKYLCAYFVPVPECEEIPETAELKEFLAAELPDFMIPSHIIHLKKIPVTAGGSVNRSALPAPLVSPRSEIERKLAAIWSKILGEDHINVTTDFFQLGGNSLKALMLVSEINQAFDVTLLVTDIFELMTIEKLAVSLQDLLIDSSASAAVENIEERDYYDVSHAQRRLWVLCQFEESSRAYNMPAAYILKGVLNPDALRRTFEKLVERHEILHTVFITVNGEPKQKVSAAKGIAFIFEEIDLRNTARQEKKVKTLVGEEIKRVFNLGKGPLVIAKLFQLEDETFLFLLNMHHIVSDGWSMGVMLEEVCMLYNAVIHGGEAFLEPLKIQYKDYSAWLNKQLGGEELNRHREYWLSQFKDRVPVLEFPCDYPRPKVKTYNGDTLSFLLPSALSRQIVDLSQSQGTSLFITLLASIKALLYRYTGQQDIVIGSAVSGRHHKDFEDQIGFYINIIAFRTVFSGSDSFEGLLEKVKKIALAAYDHEVYPFDQLVDELELDRDTSRSPLFDAAVSLNPEIGDITGERMEGVAIEGYTFDLKISRFDLLIIFTRLSEGINVTIEYNTDLFDKTRIQRMAPHYRELLDSIMNRRSAPLSRLNYLPDEEKQQILHEFNAAAREYPEDKTIHEWFEKQVKQWAAASTSVFPGMTCTYSQLNEQSNQWAHYFRANYQIEADDLVVLQVESIERLFVSLFAVLKAGGAFIPLEPDIPSWRMNYILKDSACKMVVTDKMETSPGSGEIAVPILDIDENNESAAAYSVENLESVNKPGDLACVVYESDPEGFPRGLMIEHRDLVNLVKDIKREHSGDSPLSEALPVLFSTPPLSIDAFLKKHSCYRCFILDACMNLLPIGVDGEIYIGVCRGYLNRPELTGERFIRNPFIDAPQSILYRTGEMGRFLTDGNITFMGRRDKQLTAAGQMDRSALPGPFVGPRNEIERKLAAVWSKILGEDNINVTSDFFQLGGNSLKALLLVSEINEAFDVNLLFTDIFELMTIEKLAVYLSDLMPVSSVPAAVGTIEEQEYYDVSHAQRRLWVLCQFEEASVAYNIPGAYILKGPLRPGALRRAFEMLVDRHEILRTVFITVDGVPKQKILSKEKIGFAFEEIDLRKDPHGEEKVKVLADKEGKRVYNLDKGPLVISKLIRLEEEKFLFLFSMHHIISDGWSMGIMIKEVCMLYNTAIQDEESSLLPLTIQYKDFSVWQNRQLAGEELINHREYWLSQFNGDVPVLELPCDYPRPRVKTYNGDTVGFSLPAALSRGIIEFGQGQGTSLFITLLASVKALLYRYTGQEDMVIGSPISGRVHSDLENQIGFYVNTLALRTVFNGSESFEWLLGQVKETSLAAYEHEVYPFDQLVDELELDRDTSRSPLFDVMVTLIPEIRDIPPQGMEGIKIGGYKVNSNISRFDLLAAFTQRSEGIYAVLEYNTDLFSRERIQRMSSHYQQLLTSIISDGKTPLNKLNYLSEPERHRLLVEFNDTDRNYPEAKTIHELFEEQVEQTPDKIAVVGVMHEHGAWSAALTFRELNKKSNQLARLLREKGVKPDEIVGLLVGPSLEMAAAIVGILKAGGAYLPIDPGFPGKRILSILEDSGVSVLLSEGRTLEKSLLEEDEGDVLLLDHIWEELTRYPGENLEHINHPGDLLYLISTSGSTGIAKSLIMEHRNLVNLLNFQFYESPIDFKKVLQFASIGFDVSAQEIFSTLLSGGELYLLDENMKRDVFRLLDWIQRNYLHVVYWPPAFLKLIFTEPDYRAVFPGCIRHIITAGEQLVVTEPIRRYLQDNHVYLHNHYGPAETHVVSTFIVDPAAEIAELPPIGKPICSTRLYILDKHENPVPVGIGGELYIAGANVGRGYLNKPELTAEKFDHDLWDYRYYQDDKNKKFLRGPGAVFSKSAPGRRRLYRTGDLGKWLNDGNIEFLGRVDHQVKIRGFRVELGEIESRLSGYPGIKETVVVAGVDEKGDKYLCAYFVSDEKPGKSELWEYLAESLPGYMLPSNFVSLEKIPLTPTGKINRRVLPVPEFKAEETYAAPGNEIEEKLVKIWSDVLGRDALNESSSFNVIGIDDNFFELGGHSLKATLMIAKIHKELHVIMPLVEIFKTPTIRRLAEYIKGTVKSKYAAIEPVEEKEYYMLSSAQKRLIVLQQMELESIAYNLPEFILLGEEPDVEKLKWSFRELINRHESLRTSFHLVAHEPVQKIHEEVEFGIEFYDILPTISDFVHPFDLSQAPLLRVGILKANEEKYILMVDMHHIISDGVSHEILVKDFMAFREGKPLPPLRIRYKDFCQWQNSEKEKESLKRQETYWLKEFEMEIPVLNLPIDYSRPMIQNFAGSLMGFEISAEWSNSLKSLALEANATLYMVLLAMFIVLLSKISNQEDIIIGTPVAGRRHADLEKIIGMFVNTLALRNYPGGEKTFGEFLSEVKERTLEAFENQDYPFEVLVEKLALERDRRNPLFDVMYTCREQDAGEEPEAETVEKLPGPYRDKYRYEYRTSKFDLSLNIVIRSKLFFSFEYSTELFKKETIERLANWYKEVVSFILENENIKLEEIKIKSELADTDSDELEEELSGMEF